MLLVMLPIVLPRCHSACFSAAKYFCDWAIEYLDYLSGVNRG